MVFDREGFLRKLRSFQAGSPPAPPTVPIAQYARQRALETSSTFAVGSRVYWDSTTGLVTTQITSHPLYFDPVNNRLTDKQTNIPAIYGMVANSALDESIFRAEERRRTDQSRNALAENIRLDQQVERAREKYRFAPEARGLVAPSPAPVRSIAPETIYPARAQLEEVRREIADLQRLWPGRRYDPQEIPKLQAARSRIATLQAQERELSELIRATVQSAAAVPPPEGSSEAMARERALNLDRERRAGRLTDIRREMSEIVRRGSWGDYETEPTLQATDRVRYANLQAEARSIIEAFGRDPQTVYVEGREDTPAGESVPITLTSPAAMPFTGKVIYAVNLIDNRLWHLIFEKGAQEYPLVDVALKGMGTALYWLWEKALSPVVRTPFKVLQLAGQQIGSALGMVGVEAPTMDNGYRSWLAASRAETTERVNLAGRRTGEAWQRVLSEGAWGDYDISPEALLERRQETEDTERRIGELRGAAFRGLAQMDANIMDLSPEQISAYIAEAKSLLTQAYQIQKSGRDTFTGAYRYTWSMDNDGTAREAEAEKAIIQAAMQLGRWPEPWEIEQITERYVNPALELAGDVVFGNLNLVPAVVWEKLWTKAVQPVLRIPGKITMATPIGKWWAKTLGAEAVGSAASRLGYTSSRIAGAVGRAARSTTKTLENVNRALGLLASPEALAQVSRVERLAIGLTDEVMGSLSKVVGSLGDDGAERLGRFLEESATEVRDSRLAQLLDHGMERAVAEEAAQRFAENPQSILTVFSNKVENAFINGNRLWQNGPVDEGLIAWVFKHFGGVKEGVAGAVPEAWARSAWNVTRAFNRVWSMQIGLILSGRPGYTVWNWVDSMTRALIWGAKPFDDIVKIAKDIDIPEDIMGAFARTEGLVDPDLARRLLSGEFKPRFGMFSVFADGWSKGRKIGRWTKGWGSINDVIEVTWRIRLYASHFRKQYAIIQGLMYERISQALTMNSADSPVREAFEAMDAEAGRSGSTLAQLYQDLVSGKRGPVSVLIPDELMRAARSMMGEDAARQFVGDNIRQLRELVERKQFTPENVHRFMTDLRSQIVEEVRRTTQTAEASRGAMGDLNRDTRFDPAAPPEPEEMLRRAAGEEPPRQDLFPEVRHTEPSRLQAIDGSIEEERAQIARTLKGRSTLDPEEINALMISRREQGAIRAATHRELGELVGAVRARRLAGETIPEEAIYSLDQALENIDRFVKGPVRGFIQWITFGSAEGAAETYWRKSLDRYFKLMETFDEAIAAQGAEWIRLAREGNWTELSRRMVDRDFISQAEMWRRAGWEFRVDEATGELLGFKPSGASWEITRDRALKEFLKANEITGWETRAFAEMEQPFLPRALRPIDIAPMQDTRALRMRELEQVAEARAFPEGIPQVEDLAGGIALREAREAAMTPEELAEYRSLSQAEEAAVVSEAPVAQPVQQPQVDEELTTIWDAVLGKQREGGRLSLIYRRSRLPDGRMANESIETMRTYLTGKIDEAVQADNASRADMLRHRLQSIEDDYQAMLQRAGRAEVIQPVTPVDDQGTQTWLHMAGEAESRGEQLISLLNDWETWLTQVISDGSWRLGRFTDEQKRVLGLIVEEAARLKEEGLHVASRGGEFLGRTFEGALPITNKVMIDYHSYSKFLRHLKQIFPFIKFPVRSIPMWIETMALHPELAAFYMKYLQASKRFAYQAGAWDSNGNSLSSLAGYLPIPGTDIWVNPSSPFSMRYLFPKENPYPDEDDERTPMEKVIGYVQEYGALFQFTVHPWLSSLLYELNAFKPDIAQRWSIIPQTKLLPPWTWRSLLSGLRRSRFGGIAADLLDPEVTFFDYMIERRVLRNALDALSSPDMSEAEKIALVARVQVALSSDLRQDADGNPRDQSAFDLWAEGRRQIEIEEYWQGIGGFFTGIYGKTFTDADAELLRLRDEINSLKFAMNNEVRADIFDYYPDPDKRWSFYTEERYNTPEGWLSNLYGTIRYTRTPEGKQLLGQDRLDLISQRIREEQARSAFFEGFRQAKEDLEDALSLLPLGAAPKLKDRAYQDYAASIDQLYTEEIKALFLKSNDVVGYKPKQLVYEQAREIWWSAIGALAPQWDQQNESYREWKERYDTWLGELPSIAAPMARELGVRFAQLQFVDPNSRPEDMMTRLVVETSGQGYEQWKKENDTIYTALDAVWMKIYGSPHYDILGDSGLNQEQKTLAIRQLEKQFEGEDGQPSEDQIVKAMQEIYGGQFSEDQIRKAIRGRVTNTFEARQAEAAGPLRAKMDEVFNILDLIAPGLEYGKFVDAYVAAGGDEGDLDVLYNPITGQAARDFAALSAKSEAWINETLANLRQASGVLGLDNLSDAELADRGKARDQNKVFRQQIEGTLGAEFWTTLAFYMRLSSAEKAIYRKEQPDEYAKVNAYFDSRDAYALQNPLWAKYYMGVVEARVGGGGRGGGTGGGTGGGVVGRAVAPPGGFATPGLRSTLDPSQLLRPGQLGRGGTTSGLKWPQWLLDKVGELAAAEVQALQTDGTPLAEATATYLAKLASLNVDAKPIIEETLTLNQKAKLLYGGPYWQSEHS